MRSSGDFVAEVGVLLDGAVEVGDVGLVVLVVVKLHGRFVDGGLEGGVVVGKRGKFVGHGSSPVVDEMRVQARERILTALECMAGSMLSRGVRDAVWGDSASARRS